MCRASRYAPLGRRPRAGDLSLEDLFGHTEDGMPYQGLLPRKLSDCNLMFPGAIEILRWILIPNSNQVGVLVMGNEAVRAVTTSKYARIDAPPEQCLLATGARPGGPLRTNQPDLGKLRRASIPFADARMPADEAYLRTEAIRLAESMSGVANFGDFTTALMHLELARYLGIPPGAYSEELMTGLGSGLLRCPQDITDVARTYAGMLEADEPLVRQKLHDPTDTSAAAQMVRSIVARGLSLEDAQMAFNHLRTGGPSTKPVIDRIMLEILQREWIVELFMQCPELRNGIIAEAMRMWAFNSILNTRVLDKAIKLEAGIVIPAGVPLVGSLYSVLYDPSIYPDPEVFDPYREVTTLPFGIGPHLCWSWKRAITEIKIALEAFFTAHPHVHLTARPGWNGEGLIAPPCPIMVTNLGKAVPRRRVAMVA